MDFQTNIIKSIFITQISASIDYDVFPNEIKCIDGLLHTLDEVENFSTNFEPPLPSWVNGDFYYLGPNKLEFGDKKYDYLPDGQALSSRIRINSGVSATLSRKFIKGRTWTSNSNANSIVIAEAGTYNEPEGLTNDNMTQIEKAMTRMQFSNTNMTDNTNVQSKYLKRQP